MNLRFAIAVALFGLTLGILELAGDRVPVNAQEKKKEKNPLEGKKGTVIGMLTAKEKNTIEIKADGEEKARKYFPQWKGGLPANGGGPDKEIVKMINELKIGSRLEVEWIFQERLRVLKIKVLKTPDKK